MIKLLKCQNLYWEVAGVTKLSAITILLHDMFLDLSDFLFKNEKIIEINFVDKTFESFYKRWSYSNSKSIDLITILPHSRSKYKSFRRYFEHAWAKIAAYIGYVWYNIHDF